MFMFIQKQSTSLYQFLLCNGLFQSVELPFLDHDLNVLVAPLSHKQQSVSISQAEKFPLPCIHDLIVAEVQINWRGERYDEI